MDTYLKARTCDQDAVPRKQQSLWTEMWSQAHNHGRILCSFFMFPFFTLTAKTESPPPPYFTIYTSRWESIIERKKTPLSVSGFPYRTLKVETALQAIHHGCRSPAVWPTFTSHSWFTSWIYLQRTHWKGGCSFILSAERKFLTLQQDSEDLLAAQVMKVWTVFCLRACSTHWVVKKDQTAKQSIFDVLGVWSLLVFLHNATYFSRSRVWFTSHREATAVLHAPAGWGSAVHLSGQPLWSVWRAISIWYFNQIRERTISPPFFTIWQKWKKYLSNISFDEQNDLCVSDKDKDQSTEKQPEVIVHVKRGSPSATNQTTKEVSSETRTSWLDCFGTSRGPSCSIAMLQSQSNREPWPSKDIWEDCCTTSFARESRTFLITGPELQMVVFMHLTLETQ